MIASAPAHTGKKGETGMKRWGKISVLFALCAALWLAGSAFVAPFRYRGGTVDGLELKGLTPAAAERVLRERYVRELQGKNLFVEAAGDEYEFTYPEIGYSSDLAEVLKAARDKKGDYTVSRRFFLLREEETLGGICENYARRAVSARVRFTGDYDKPFEYTEGSGAHFIDFEQLQKDVRRSLETNFSAVVAKTMYAPEACRRADLEKERAKLSSFTTCFSAEKTARVHNIALAAEKINGCILADGEEFSFNGRVGARTESNGFLSAPIILEGDFVEGVGGGVCQASTTVYNAALLAGMEITEQHPHSLRVGYVEPSFDAMVSGKTCDLKFRNTSGKNIYIVCKTTGNSISVGFYGLDNGVKYVRKSVVKEEILPPEQEVVAGDEDKVLRAEKKGLVSEGYLIAYRDGKPVSTRKIRRDKYAAVRGKVQKIEKTVA